MIPEERTGPDQAIDRFWDQVALGRADVVDDLDPGDAATIRFLHAADDRPGPSLAFKERLREDLMHASAIPVDGGPGVHPLPNGRVSQPWWASPQRLPSSRRRWVLAQLATAALLLLTLVGSFIAFGPNGPGRQQFAPTLIPAVSATVPMPQSDGVATKILLDLVIPAISADRAWVQIDRYTFPPATTMHVDLRSGLVPEVFYVADGVLEIRAMDAPQPVRVVRPGGPAAEVALASGESAALPAGDGFVVPESGTADLMNLSSEPATVLLLLVPRSVDLPGNSTIGYETLVGSLRNVSAPLALTLTQVTLAPDASLPGVDAPNVEQVIIPVDPSRMVDTRSGSNGAVHNAGDEPLDAYVLTITSNASPP